MKRKISLIVLSTGFVMLLLVSIAMASSIGTPESPGQHQADDDVAPTPTYLPVPDDFAYTIEEINASGEVITFEDQAIDGFSITDFTYQTRYPFGLEFTATITPPEDAAEIVSINLVYRFPADTGSRVAAEPTGNDNEYRAVPYDTRGLPPWMEMKVWWRIAYGETGLVETEPVSVQYADPTRTWWRAESGDAIIYWFDFPRELGDVVVDAFAKVRGRYIAGFGAQLLFKPTVIIFPPGEAMGEWRSGGQINPRTTGQASGDTYSAVLRVRGLEIEDIREECVWNEERDLEWQMRFAASVATHEVAHLYQYAFFGARGPAWWIEGQATFFELEMGPVDARLRRLASLGEDLSTLQGGGPSGNVGTPAVDGCTHLGYEMGASFVNWLVNEYGFEVHRQIVELNSRNVPLDDALEEATGVSFLDLERAWRAYIGLDPEPNIPPTIEFVFPPTMTPFGQ